MNEDDLYEHQNDAHSSSGSGIGIVGLIVVGLLIWWGYNHFLKSDTWQANYEASYQTAVGVGPSFSNKEACLAWINEQRLHPAGRSSFECGSNCKPPNTSIGPWRCDETVD